MAFNRKNWQDNVSDITAAELNRIEQGIYDNSLVVDAVTNTINPTDTETYKTAELTEGQITDVIAVSDIVIKGQTSQDGIPTPSAPVDVNVVSGSNIVNTSNKNLFIPTLKVDNTSIFVNNATVSLIKDEYTFIASGSDMYFGQVGNTGTTYLNTNGMKIYKNGNTKLSFLVTNTTFNRVHITAYNSQGVSLGYTAFTGISGTYTFPENCEFVTIRIGKNTAVSGTTYKTKVMVVYGDTIPTTYEPHQGKKLPLDLPVENLCPTSSMSTINGGYINASTGNLGSVIAGKTYTLSFKNNSSYTANIALRIIYDNTYSTETSANLVANGLITYTFTASHSGTVALSGKVEKDVTNIFTQMQLEQGSKANAYTPYGTEPIELCKIGNYQDYFYKSGSKWYLHKEILKIIIPSSVNGVMQNSNKRFFVNKTKLNNCDILHTPYGGQTYGLYCDILKEVTAGQTWSGIQGISYDYNETPGSGGLNFSINGLTTAAEYQEALEGKIIVARLNTPTNTEITDTTLISQLEAIYNAPLYEETNITQENNDLPMILDITACKDNINGIKAFIRK